MNRSVNFFAQLERQGLHRQAKKKSGSGAFLIVVLALVLLGGLSYMGVLLFKNHSLGVQIRAIEGFVNDPVVTAEYERVAGKLAQMGDTNEYAGKLETFYELLLTHPEMDAQLLQIIWSLKGGETTVMTFSFDADRFTLGCISRTRAGPANFADSLSAHPLFYDVEYTGFTRSEDGSYAFSLTGLVKGGGENEAE